MACCSLNLIHLVYNDCNIQSLILKQVPISIIVYLTNTSRHPLGPRMELLFLSYATFQK